MAPYPAETGDSGPVYPIRRYFNLLRMGRGSLLYKQEAGRLQPVLFEKTAPGVWENTVIRLQDSILPRIRGRGKRKRLVRWHNEGKKNPLKNQWIFMILVGRGRLERPTNGLKVRCSTN